MDDHSLLSCVIGPCPKCGNGRLESISDGTDRRCLCLVCGTCYRSDRGVVRCVDPSTCRGCPSKNACTTARRAYAALAHSSAPALEAHGYLISDETGSPVVEWGAAS